MEKQQREKLLMLCKKIEKEEGDGSIYTLDSSKMSMNIKRQSTYIEDLDFAIGGGIPEGRMIEIYGPESSGKTSLAYYLASLYDMVLFIPAEGTFDYERAKSFGNKKGQMVVYNNQYGEDALEKVLEFTKAGIPLIIVDSIPFLMPREEYETAERDLEKEFRIGGIARLMKKALPSIIKAQEKSGTTIIFINQVRDKMDAMMFGEKTQTPGGHLLKHSYSLRIQVARRAWIDIPNKDPRNSAANEKIGLIMKGKVTKSKVCNPFSEFEIPLLFPKGDYKGGFVSHDDMLEKRKEYMAMNRKRKKKEAEDEE